VVNCLGWCCRKCIAESEREEEPPRQVVSTQPRSNMGQQPTSNKQEVLRVNVQPDLPYSNMGNQQVNSSNPPPFGAPVYYTNNNNANGPSAPPLTYVPKDNASYVVGPSQPILNSNSVDPTYGTRQVLSNPNQNSNVTVVDMTEEEKQQLKVAMQRSLGELQQNQREKLQGNGSASQTVKTPEGGSSEVQVEGKEEQKEDNDGVMGVASKAGSAVGKAGSVAANWGGKAGKAALGWSAKKVQQLNEKYNNKDGKPGSEMEPGEEGNNQ